MQAIGMIETRGVLAAIESADVMLKTANVSLVSKEKVGGGLITVIVEGDVAAVKASVEAGAYAVENLDKSLLVSKHVIPRPVSDVHDLLLADIKELKEESKIELEDTEYVEINSKADFEQARLKADESLLLRSLERLTNPKLKEIILDMDKSCDAKNLAKLSKLKLIEKLMSIPKR